MKRNILVTGAAGFMGFHTCQKLIKKGFSVIGIDNLNNYYDPKLKLNRLKELENLNQIDNFRFLKIDLIDRKLLFSLFEEENFDIVIHLAAQAGVRYSIINPEAYINSNLVGFNNLMEACRDFCELKNFIFASSSSVYGGNNKTPFSEEDNVDHPVSLYAATKKANELFAHTYSHLYNIPCTGLRFFTVYGPWGRPDMALFLFTKAIFENKKINVYNYGNHSRDFTYIDDIVEGVYNTISKDSKNSDSYKLYNIGNSKPVELMDFINLIEKNLGKKANKKMLPMQAGDVEKTYASTVKLSNDYDYTPKTPIDFGVKSFIDWYVKYYNINE